MRYIKFRGGLAEYRINSEVKFHKFSTEWKETIQIKHWIKKDKAQSLHSENNLKYYYRKSKRAWIYSVSSTKIR